MTEFRFPKQALADQCQSARTNSEEESSQTHYFGQDLTSAVRGNASGFSAQVTSTGVYEGIIGKTTYNGTTIASDQRKKIASSVITPPYKSLVRISTQNGGAGTGVIIGPRHILTSAHTVWNLATKAKNPGILVRPQATGAWLSVSSGDVFVHNQFTNQPNLGTFDALVEACKWDFAVLRTAQTIATGSSATGGYFQYNYYSNAATVLTLALRFLGFPGVSLPCRDSVTNTNLFWPNPFGICNGLLYETTAGSVLNVSVPGVFQHSFDSASGMSGGPIFQHYADTKRSVVLAIESFGRAGYGNFASAITLSIKSWISAVISGHP